MTEPKKPPSDAQNKTAQVQRSGSHPIARSGAVALTNVAKPIKVGTGQSRANLMRSDVDEYARSQTGAAGVQPSSGLFEKLSGGVKALLKKFR